MVSMKAVVTGGAVAAAGAAVALSQAASRPPSAWRDYSSKGFKRRDITTPAGRMAVYEGGSGKPLVFLHGIGGGASSWTWFFVAPEFTYTHRIVVPDGVGWGSSEHPARFILFEDYIASLEALLEGLGEPAIIVAQSLASGFAMALAERRPDLVERFVFNTPSGGKDFGEDAFGPLARATITPGRLPGIGFAFYKALFHRRAFIGGWFRQEGPADPAKVTREIVDAFLFSARQPNAAYSALPFATGELRYDIAPYLERLKVPASMFWGAEETQVGIETGERLAALRPDVPFTLIEDSKACPELEQPQAFAAAIRKAIGDDQGSSLD